MSSTTAVDINSTSTQSNSTGSSDIFKTPISTLQEYCQKLGKTPQYDLTALEGRSHQPQFVYRCMVGDVTATGQGGSKKQAKQAAAKAVLTALTADLVPAEADQDKEQNLTVATIAPRIESEDINPVGALQELVVARGWRIPVYTLAHETGPAHKKEFIVCCCVESFKEYGTGSAKKHAKRMAAANMHKKLISLPQEAKESVTSQSREAKTKVSLDEITNSFGEKLSCGDIEYDVLSNPCQALQNIAKQNKLEIVYKDIDRETGKGNMQCLIELNTLPVSLFHGTGNTLEDAHKDAAEHAIDFIKIFNESNTSESEN